MFQSGSIGSQTHITGNQFCCNSKILLSKYVRAIYSIIRVKTTLLCICQRFYFEFWQLLNHAFVILLLYFWKPYGAVNKTSKVTRKDTLLCIFQRFYFEFWELLNQAFVILWLFRILLNSTVRSGETDKEYHKRTSHKKIRQ